MGRQYFTQGGHPQPGASEGIHIDSESDFHQVSDPPWRDVRDSQLLNQFSLISRSVVATRVAQVWVRVSGLGCQVFFLKPEHCYDPLPDLKRLGPDGLL